MSLLASVAYDPVAAASKATSALIAMTALDTTNLRTPSFTAPANGTVLCRVRGNTTGATTYPTILLGVLDGSTVRGRATPIQGRTGGSASAQSGSTAAFLVTGLTPSSSYQFDAAYGVELAVASSNIRYGGDNTTGSGAFGACSLDVWDTDDLLWGTHYDPSTVADTSVAATTVMTALDTTNLRATFTAPASGQVLVKMRGVVHGTTSATGSALLFGVLDGSTIMARQHPVVAWHSVSGTPAATDHMVNHALMLVTGLTPSASYTWDAALSVEITATSGKLSWGGPDDTTQDTAYGGFAYEIWDAGGVPLASVYATGQVF